MKLCLPLPLVVLISVALHASRVQRSFGFIAVAPATKKKPSDAGSCGTLLPDSAPFYHFVRHCVSVNGTKKVVSDKEVVGEANGVTSDTIALDASENKTGGKGKKKRKTTSTTKRKKSTEPSYWHDENDPFIIVANEEVYTTGGEGDNIREGEVLHKQQLRGIINDVNIDRKSIKFTIRGNPRVLIRHRTARGFMYNPSRATQDLFRDCLLELLPRKYHPTIIDDESMDDDDDGAAPSPTVLFADHEFLKLSISFRMKRPMSHFIGNKPAPGRLKSTAPGKLHSTRSDVDNLAKFVMDSLNGLVYVDDRQVVDLNAIKVLDSEGLCRGATEIEISTLKEEDLM
mmetsp:Transcript_13467/g.29250  ORF Transcript_13467/g.29250 Transcript_13467/m.29250 type:complete len:343 (+) Transcript_13467:154-1182(+)